jgi:glycosyltransferase involved in cell wall biosynthesis
MKVVFANNYFYLRGGSERVIFEEIEMLKANKHEVIPFSRHNKKNISSNYMKYFASPIEYENVSTRKKIIAGLKLIYSSECKKKIYELLTSFNPHTVHAHNIYGRLTTAVIDAASEKEIPVVMTLHDYKLLCPSYLMLSDGNVCEKCRGKQFYYCAIERCHKSSFFPSLIYTAESYFNKWFKKYDRIKYFICPSKFLQRKLDEAGFNNGRVVYIPNCVKIDNYEPDYTPGDYILFVGRLSKEKGILTLLRAVKGLNIKVKLIGDGPMRAEYEAYTKENDITNVSFEGYKSGAELNALYRNAVFLVFPSEWYENAPMTILEAFAYGKPVIGSNIGGIPEMVLENETGFYFEPGNHHELREKIEYLLSKPSLIIDMGKRARQKVEKEYNSEMHYQQLMKVYKRALS